MCRIYHLDQDAPTAPINGSEPFDFHVFGPGQGHVAATPRYSYRIERHEAAGAQTTVVATDHNSKNDSLHLFLDGQEIAGFSGVSGFTRTPYEPSPFEKIAELEKHVASLEELAKSLRAASFKSAEDQKARHATERDTLKAGHAAEIAKLTQEKDRALNLEGARQEDAWFKATRLEQCLVSIRNEARDNSWGANKRILRLATEALFDYGIV